MGHNQVHIAKTGLERKVFMSDIRTASSLSMASWGACLPFTCPAQCAAIAIALACSKPGSQLYRMSCSCLRGAA